MTRIQSLKGKEAYGGEVVTYSTGLDKSGTHILMNFLSSIVINKILVTPCATKYDSCK